MAKFSIAGQTVELPAANVAPSRDTRDKKAWLDGEWITVQVEQPIQGIRVHTNGKAFVDREASHAAGAWVAIGDVILTSKEMVDQSALPGPFTHVSEAEIPAGCIVNVGFNAALLAGRGGGTQVEYVAGPPFKFTQLGGAYWHSEGANA